jgi:hypothetical protein
MNLPTIERTFSRPGVRDRRTLIWLTALIALCIVILALWAPFGLRRTAWGDAWVYYGTLFDGVSLAPRPTSRPLIWLPWVVSYHLVPTSFLGLNLLIAVFVLLKGVLVYAITRLLAPRAAGLALAAALLAMVYPAEVGYFFDGFLNLHQGFDAYLLAVFFLLAWWKRGSRWLLAAAIASLAFSIATYEAVLALVAGTPLLLVFVERRVTRRLVWTALLWWSPIAIYLVYVVLIRASVGLNAREAGLLSSGLNVPNLPLEVLSANLWNLGQRYFDAWRSALTLSPFNGSSPLFAIAVFTGAVIAAVFYAHFRVSHPAARPGSSHNWPARRWFELFALSILWTVLGYAVFSLASVRYEGWRLGFYTVLGSSLTVALLVYGITSHRRISWLFAGLCVALAVIALLSRAPFGWTVLALVAALGFALPRPINWSVIVGILLTIAVVRQLDLHRWLTSEALESQQLLSNVTLAAPGLEPGTAVVLVVETASSDPDVPLDSSVHLDRALDLIYENPGYVGLICPLGLVEWGFDDETCRFDAAGIVVEVRGDTSVTPYEDMVVVLLGADQSVRLVEQLPAVWGAPDHARYDPWSHLDQNAPPPASLQRLLNPRPLIER